MLKKTKLFLPALTIAIAFLVVTSSFGNGFVIINTLYSCTTDDPNVDGVLGATEWLEGSPIAVTLYDLNNQTNQLDIEIMSVLGRDHILYFGITIPDTDVGREDYFFIVFDDAEGSPIVDDPKPDGAFSLGHDTKSLLIGSNQSLDGFTSATQFDLKEDVINGGTENSNGKCHFNATHITMEIRTPLNTGDSLGYDINTAVNQSINIFLWYHDSKDGIDYSQIREADYDYDVIKLTLSCTAPIPIPIQPLIIGLFGVTVFTLIIKKRKQRK
ncbi:MAG: hypothetical protein ACTSWD_07060 [Candidatus Heimdallarchaeota archaeon]